MDRCCSPWTKQSMPPASSNERRPLASMLSAAVDGSNGEEPPSWCVAACYAPRRLDERGPDRAWLVRGCWPAAPPSRCRHRGQCFRPIECALGDERSIPADVVALARFAAAHYRAPLSEALRATLPPGLGIRRPGEARAEEERRRRPSAGEDAAVPGSPASAAPRRPGASSSSSSTAPPRRSQTHGP